MTPLVSPFIRNEQSIICERRERSEVALLYPSFWSSMWRQAFQKITMTLSSRYRIPFASYGRRNVARMAAAAAARRRQEQQQQQQQQQQHCSCSSRSKKKAAAILLSTRRFRV